MLGLSLRLSQQLTQREELEMALYQNCVVLQSLQLQLRQYQKRESTFTRLYKRALEKGKVSLYNKHGMKFEYALVSSRDVHEYIEKYGYAFSHCLFNAFDAFLYGKHHALSRGSWLLFVVEDLFPNDSFKEYAAVHERGEQVTVGDHTAATKLEFSVAKKERQLGEYMSWIEASYPGKFSDVFNYQTHVALPQSETFQEILEKSLLSEEAQVVQELIQSFEWPRIVLDKLMQYKKKNDRIRTIIVTAFRATEDCFIHSSGKTIKETIDRAHAVFRNELSCVKKEDLMIYASIPALSASWEELFRNLGDFFFSYLDKRKRYDSSYMDQVIEAGVSGSFPQREGGCVSSCKNALSAL